MKRYLFIGFVAILVVLIVYSGPLFETKLIASASISQFFGLISSDLSGLGERIVILEEENQYLRDLLNERYQENKNIKVYSSYPFNSRVEIAIAAGEDNGVRVGDAIVYGGNILVGRVKNVFDKSSIVTTIFDPSWEIQVRIGETEIDALMRGGNELLLTLISAEDHIEDGDLVIVASRDLPYGLEVGFVKSVDNVPGEVFQEAVLEPNLQLKKLRDVTVYR